VLNSQKNLAFIPALTWAGIIVFMSLLPSKELPTSLLVSDKIIHSLIYFGLTSMLFLATIYISESTISKHQFNKLFLISAIISFILGILVEIAQEKMNIGRSGDVNDVIANLLGTIIVYPIVKKIQYLSIFNNIFNTK
jgi:VanZ family protein